MPNLSLFTPAHSVEFLPEAFASLQLQNYSDFEWIVCVNGKAKTQEWPKQLTDSRIRRIEIPDNVGSNVGALKRFACDQCCGSIFAEFDYDDLLVPETLPKVIKAFEAGAGFVYSDSAAFRPDLTSFGYTESCGWEHYEINVYGRAYKVSKCFDLHPRMLCEVYFAPDHIRCWSRKAYYEAGGHDKTMSVGDDHDLVCRTFLTGAEFKHIGCCGYLYRWHGSNTVTARQDAIIKQQTANRNKYLRPLITEWTRRTNGVVLDLYKIWENSEWYPEAPGIDPGLYAENSVAHIIGYDVLQFVPPHRQGEFFDSAYRCLKPGGFLSLEVPSENGAYASMNPNHLTRFNRNSFLYYTNRDYRQQSRVPGSNAIRFQSVMQLEFYHSEEHKKMNMACIREDLMALKGDLRLPGYKYI